jgi:hypothetical protein
VVAPHHLSERLDSCELVLGPEKAPKHYVRLEPNGWNFLSQFNVNGKKIGIIEGTPFMTNGRT